MGRVTGGLLLSATFFLSLQTIPTAFAFISRTSSPLVPRHWIFFFTYLQVKVAKTVLLLIGVYIVTWIPILVIHFLRVARIGYIPDSVDLAAAFLMSMSCVTNPWIYGYRNRHFRDQLRRMLCITNRVTHLVKRQQEMNNICHHKWCYRHYEVYKAHAEVWARSGSVNSLFHHHSEEQPCDLPVLSSFFRSPTNSVARQVYTTCI